MLANTSDDRFDQDTAQGLTLTDFGASWCGPCHMEAPIIKQLSQDLNGQVKFFKMDVDQNPQTSQKLGIMGIPTMVIKKDGQVVDSVTGVHNGNQLKAILKRHM